MASPQRGGGEPRAALPARGLRVPGAFLIRPLVELAEADFRRLVVGYESRETWRATVEERDDELVFRFVLTPLERPFEKRWRFDPGQFGWYRTLLPLGLSFAAEQDGELVGIAIAGASEWNRTVDLWELHVSPAHRGRGHGRALLAAVEAAAAAKRYRAVSIETQNTNVPAIRFYRAAGYVPRAVDTTFYANDDLERGEVCLFLRKALDPRRQSQ